ncbi:MAG: hypothetical protein J6D36_01395 [Erysipelotrichaceae bacterium]|jgi:hypothetical protein|nr:hypothetical protein [Erysipelotrichaceae bacterium]
MKKTEKIITFTALAAAAAVTFTACQNQPVALYGPPDEMNAQSVEIKDQE